MKDTPLKTDLRPGFNFSQTSLQDYVDCPRRFLLRYVERLPWPAVESEPIRENERRQQEGQIFHRMVQQHLTGIPADKICCPAAMPGLQKWWENYLELSDRLGLAPAQGGSRTPAVEALLSAPIGDYRLLAKYDLIVVDPAGKAIIYDWKTTIKRPRDEWMAGRMQTQVYRSLLVLGGKYLNQGRPIAPERIEMIYWYADFPMQPCRFSYSEAQYDLDRAALGDLIAKIACCREFPVSDQEVHCTYCTYRSYCDRGEKAGRMEAVDAESGFQMDLDKIAEIEL